VNGKKRSNFLPKKRLFNSQEPAQEKSLPPEKKGEPLFKLEEERTPNNGRSKKEALPTLL